MKGVAATSGRVLGPVRVQVPITRPALSTVGRKMPLPPGTIRSAYAGSSWVVRSRWPSRCSVPSTVQVVGAGRRRARASTERLVALEVPGLRDPFVEQDDHLLTARVGGAKDDGADHGRVAPDVRAALPAPVEPGPLAEREQVRAAQPSAAGQRRDHLGAPPCAGA